MAEAEITIRDDDDLLREINQHGGTVASVLESQGQPWLRARGSADSVLSRSRFPFEDTNVFDSCQHCHTALSGCVVGGRRSVPGLSIIMSCGHVLCEPCKDACRQTRQEKSEDPPLFECPICKEFGSANRLPGPDGANLSTCQASYCTGESFEASQYRCVPCQRNLCDDCIPTHEQKFPDHELTPRTTMVVDPKRAFTVCASHQMPVAFRCDCGEMLCARCPYNYLSHVPGTSQVQHHGKTKMEEVDLCLEDALGDTIGTVSLIRRMRSVAAQKREELEETTDRVANEVALHFNQIIIQAIQRCFDVLTGLKKLGSTHHSAIEDHLKMLDKTERQLIVGVEMDERARCRHSLKTESVAQYVRNVAYGLCKPAIAQFEDSKEFSSRLEDTQFGLVIRAPDTKGIAERIGRWGECVMTNAEDLANPMKEVRILPSKPLEAASIVHAEGIKDILSGEPIDSSSLPLRLHCALEHFTDLYERRFRADTMEIDFETPREMPFQLGERSPPEARMSRVEIEARYAYERLMLSRPGMLVNPPKIFGGYRRIYNLVQRTQMIKKDVQETYARTPCLAPIWMADGDNLTDITPLGPMRQQDLQRLQQTNAAAAVARAEDSGSPDSLFDLSRPASAAEDEVEALPSTSRMQQPPPQKSQLAGKTVLRKKNLVLIKRPQSPPVLQPQALPPPLQPRPLPYGSPAPSRLLGPSILRRQMPPPPAPVGDGTVMHFRPATSAERVAAGVAAARKAPQVLLTDPAADQLQQRRLRLVPSPTMGRPMDGRTRIFRDSSGRMHMIPAQQHSQMPRHLPRPGQYQSHQAGTSGGMGASGRASDRHMEMEIDDVVELDGGLEPGERPPPIRVNTARAPENRYMDILKNRSMPAEKRVLFTPEEEDRRITLRHQGFREYEINQVIFRDRAKGESPYSNLRVVVPAYRIGNASNSNRTRFSGDQDRMGGQPKKRMLPIERAFTNMFGADGSLIPELSRRRGRPAKDDPTAPSNIIAQFKRGTTQWPPKFDEMGEEEIADLQDLINQLDAVTRDEGEERPYYNNGDLVLPWHAYTPEEREQLKTIAQEKIKGAQGCFVCKIFRDHEGKPRDWQCNECMERGRPLTPFREGEVVEPPQKKQRKEVAVLPPVEEEMEEEGEAEEEIQETQEEEEESAVDLSALFPVAPKVERRGRPRKHPKPEEPKEPPKRVAREPRKRRDPVVEEAEPEEEVVMGTTRRGRQIKMPAKLKGHEVSTASTTRRSPSEASEVPSESASSAPTPTTSTPARASPTKKKVEETPAEKLKQIKEETPEPAPLRSAMDAPRRGGRRRH